jgi:tetratricopeptide (TPR) repeat protein
MSDLRKASELAQAGELDDAWAIIEKHLLEQPDDYHALVIGTFVMDKARKLAVAYQLAQRVTTLAPDRFEGWLNFGRICDQVFKYKEGVEAFKKALPLAKSKEQRRHLLTNLGALYVTMGEWDEAEKTSRESLAISGSRKAHANLGIALLAKRQWAEGWPRYHCGIGSEQRKYIQYANEPEWDGAKGKKVAIYGEQGLGDEISFASMVPDAIKDCSKVVLECDHRLAKLFRRSFPKATVYGTRWNKNINWAVEDRKLDASCTIAKLGEFYRNADSDFPGTAYLTADPERRLQWRALFDSKRKPAIGVAWSGGVQWTGAQFRKWNLAQMLPIFKSLDAHWVSLQYKDASEDIAAFKDASIVQYPWATLTNDYDDTAALVAELDLVICMQTAVAHLCGALGKECWVFVPNKSQWRYGSEGDSIPWYKSVQVFRQAEDGSWPLRQAANMLKLRYQRAA